VSTRRNFARAARKIEAFSHGMRQPLGSGLRQIGEEIMTDVKASAPGYGVPVDTGALRASGRVEGPRSDLTVLLSFGDAATSYALRQHEELDYRHPVGEARYLVRGVDRWRPGGSAAIRALRRQAEWLAARIGRVA
jgi:hypothetical protein